MRRLFVNSTNKWWRWRVSARGASLSIFVASMMLVTLLAACGGDVPATPVPATITTTSAATTIPAATTTNSVATATTSIEATSISSSKTACATVAVPLGSARVMLVEGAAHACEHNRPCSTPAVAAQTLVYTDGEARTEENGRMVLQTNSIVIDMAASSTLHLTQITNSFQELWVDLGRVLLAHDACDNTKIVVRAGHVETEAVDTTFIITNTGTVDVGVLTGTVTVNLIDPETKKIIDSKTLTDDVGKNHLRIPAIGNNLLPVPDDLQEKETYWERKQEWVKIPGINPISDR